jgi:hypothetical protein
MGFLHRFADPSLPSTASPRPGARGDKLYRGPLHRVLARICRSEPARRGPAPPGTRAAKPHHGPLRGVLARICRSEPARHGQPLPGTHAAKLHRCPLHGFLHGFANPSRFAAASLRPPPTPPHPTVVRCMGFLHGFADPSLFAAASPARHPHRQTPPQPVAQGSCRDSRFCCPPLGQASRAPARRANRHPRSLPANRLASPMAGSDAADPMGGNLPHIATIASGMVMNPTAGS